MPTALIYGVWITFAAVFGLMCGSFLNVCIYRLPAGLTIVRGHSFCPNCRHTLGMFDLIPVLSYLLLRRRCRYCSQPISARYMWIELLTGVYFALAAAVWRPGIVSPPYWLAALAGRSSELQAALLLLLAGGFAFCGLLVWAMINWDGLRVPAGVYIFAALPVLVRLLIQPPRLINHLAALLLTLLVTLFIWLIRLLPAGLARHNIGLGIGLLLIALMGGLFAAQAVLAVVLAELLYLTVSGRRSKSRAMPAGLLWRSLPLQALLIGSILWLFF